MSLNLKLLILWRCSQIKKADEVCDARRFPNAELGMLYIDEIYRMNMSVLCSAVTELFNAACCHTHTALSQTAK